MSNRLAFSVRRFQVRHGLDRAQLRYMLETFRLGTCAEFFNISSQEASLIRSRLGLPPLRRGPPSAAQRAVNGAAPTSRYFG